MTKVVGILILPLVGAAVGAVVVYTVLKALDDAWQRIVWG